MTLSAHTPPLRGRAAHVSPRRRRVALYSHDTQGLGHIRRNITLAAALVEALPGTDVLLLTGAPEATTLPLPPHTDVVTLPTLHKASDGSYAARALSTPLAALLQMRSSIIEATLSSFAPDLFIVDKVARGVDGELDASLAMLRREGAARVVLGLRDVLDDPVTTRREWAAAGTTDAVLASYDAIWVYGDPEVYDPVREYGLPAAVAAKVAYTGYLGRYRGKGTRIRTQSRPHTPPAPRTRPYALCLVGGGQDGFELADAFVRAELPPGVDGVVLTGPYMCGEVREGLRRAGRGRPEMSVLGFVPDADATITGAAAVVSMAGYNSVCELLAAGRPTLLVPRISPRLEQRIRADRLRRLDVVDVIEPDCATPERIGRWLACAVAGGPPRRGTPDLDGLLRIPVLAATLLGSHRGLRTVGGAEAAPREELADVAI